MAKERKELSLKGVKVLGVTSPNRIAQIAEEKGISCQEVFVRVIFEYKGKEYVGSNQLRFFRQEGYQKLLDARDNETLVNVTIAKDDKGILMYLDSDKEVSVADLFAAEPTVKPAPTKKDLSDLF